MTLLPRILPIAAAACLAAAAPAAAAPITASIDDGTDSGARGPGSDMQQVRTTFDADAGTWSVTVRFYGPMADAEWAMVNATIFTPSSKADDCTYDNKSFAWFRTSTKPGTTTLRGAVGAYDDGRQPDGTLGESPFAHLTRTVSADGRELTVDGDAPRLIGREPGCVTVNMSYNGVIDALSPGVVFATRGTAGDGGTPPPPVDGDPSPPPPGDGGLGMPLTLRLAPGTTTIRAAMLRVRLAPLSAPASGTAKLLADGRTLARAHFAAKAQRAVTIDLRRTAYGRTWIRRHRSGRVRLAITAQAADGTPSHRTFVLRLR